MPKIQNLTVSTGFGNTHFAANLKDLKLLDLRDFTISAPLASSDRLENLSLRNCIIMGKTVKDFKFSPKLKACLHLKHLQTLLIGTDDDSRAAASRILQEIQSQ
jgi:hypothetical protein